MCGGGVIICSASLTSFCPAATGAFGLRSAPKAPVAAGQNDVRLAEQIMTPPPHILYCNCTYAQVVPKEVKEAVLKKLCESGVAFDAVGDLCEMSARRDPSLKRLAEAGAVKIAACYPRAVKWLFHAAKADLPADAAEVRNMRGQNAEEGCVALCNGE